MIAKNGISFLQSVLKTGCVSDTASKETSTIYGDLERYLRSKTLMIYSPQFKREVLKNVEIKAAFKVKHCIKSSKKLIISTRRHSWIL